MVALLSLIGSLLATQLIFLMHAGSRLWVARRLGLEVASIQLGWGPRLRARQRSDGSTLTIHALPALAIVRVRGHDAADDAPSYRELHGASHLGKRLAFVLASPLFYLLLVWVPLWGIAMLWGWPGHEIPTTRIAQVLPQEPAATAGVEVGDRVLSVEDTPVSSAIELITALGPRANRATRLIVERDGARLALTVTPRPRPDGGARIGVMLDPPARPLERRDPINATVIATQHLGTALVTNARAFVRAISETQVRALTGPVGMAAQPAQPVHSVTVAMVTLLLGRFFYLAWLPFHFCAGGRLLLLLPEVLGRGQPSAKTERRLSLLTGLVYLLVTALVIANDIQ